MYCALGVPVPVPVPVTVPVTVTVTVILVSGLRFTCEEVDVVITLGSSCEEHAMWMKCRRRDGGATVRVDPSGVWLHGGELLTFKVEDLDSVFRCSAIEILAYYMSEQCRSDLHSKYRQVLVCACRSQHIASCPDRLQRLIHTDVPQLDLAIAAGREQFTLPTTLHVDRADPVLVIGVLPLLHHRRLRLLADVENPDSTVTKAGDKNIASHLIRGERGDA